MTAHKRNDLAYVDDLDVAETTEPAIALTKPKRVKVRTPFLVCHDGTRFLPEQIAEVPAAVANDWLRNHWVTEAD